MGVPKTRDHIQIKNKVPNPSQEPPKPQIRTLRTWMFFAPSKSRKRAKIWNMDVSYMNDHIQIKIKIPNHS